VLGAVPACVDLRVFQPEVGAEIDYARAPLEHLRDCLDRRAVGESEEHHVGVGSEVAPARSVQRLRGEPAQVREHVRDRPALLAERRQMDELHARVAREPPDDLSAGIAGSARNAGANPVHLHIYT
jgi:hypothetical protein